MMLSKLHRIKKIEEKLRPQEPLIVYFVDEGDDHEEKFMEALNNYNEINGTNFTKKDFENSESIVVDAPKVICADIH